MIQIINHGFMLCIEYIINFLLLPSYFENVSFFSIVLLIYDQDDSTKINPRKHHREQKYTEQNSLNITRMIPLK
jgi:hypothetical protein